MGMESLKKHEDEITGIVSDTLRETFKTYFDLDIGSFTNQDGAGSIADGVVCKTVFKNGIASGAVFVSFEKPFLQIVSGMIYPPEAANSQESFHSCAAEIANIVSNRVKTYLNDQGYSLKMGIPSIEESADEADDDINISFSVKKKKLFVDIIFKEHSKTAA